MTEDGRRPRELAVEQGVENWNPVVSLDILDNTLPSLKKTVPTIGSDIKSDNLLINGHN